MSTLRQRSPAATARDLADRELAAQLPELEDELDAAVVALQQASVAQLPPETIRARYRTVTGAFDAVVAAADAGYRLAVGPVDGIPHTRVIAARGRPAAVTWRHLTQQLRLARQRHLLSASPVWAGAVPDCDRDAVPSATGPSWSRTGFLPADVADAAVR